MWFFCFVFGFFGAKDHRSMIFSVSSPVWAIAGDELGSLSIQLNNSMTVHDNSWALKLWNSIIFLNFKTSLVIASKIIPLKLGILEELFRGIIFQYLH